MANMKRKSEEIHTTPRKQTKTEETSSPSIAAIHEGLQEGPSPDSFLRNESILTFALERIFASKSTIYPDHDRDGNAMMCKYQYFVYMVPCSFALLT